jgi:NHS family xanthosine MFS transporter
MNFLEFFVWGSWLISLGAYMFNVLHFTGVQVGSIYGTMGIASIVIWYCGRSLAECRKGIGALSYCGRIAVVLGLQSNRLSHAVFYYAAEFLRIYANHRVK